jgi:hypothetical protein
MLGVSSSAWQFEAGIDTDNVNNGGNPYFFVEAYNPSNVQALLNAGWFNESPPSLYYAYYWGTAALATTYSALQVHHDSGAVGNATTWHFTGPSGTPSAASATVSFAAAPSAYEYYQNEARVTSTSTCPRGWYNFPNLTGFGTLGWDAQGADPSYMHAGAAKFGQYIQFPDIECFNCNNPPTGAKTLAPGPWWPQIIEPFHPRSP